MINVVGLQIGVCQVQNNNMCHNFANLMTLFWNLTFSECLIASTNCRCHFMNILCVCRKSLAGGRWISLFNSVHGTADQDTHHGPSFHTHHHIMHIMVKYLNLVHSVLNIFFFQCRIKCFSSDKISAQVSFFYQGWEMKHWAGILTACRYSISHTTRVTYDLSKISWCILKRLHGSMQALGGPAYFARVLSYERKMFMKSTTGSHVSCGPLSSDSLEGILQPLAQHPVVWFGNLSIFIWA